MTWYTLVPLITSLVFLGVGLMVLFHNYYSQINRSFFIMCFSTSVWQISSFFLFYSSNVDLIVSLGKVAYVAAIFMPYAFYNFINKFLKINRVKEQYIVFAVSLVLMFLLLSTNLILNGYVKYAWGYYPKAGSLHTMFVVYAFILNLIGVSRLLFYRTKTPSKKIQNHLVYMFIAAVPSSAILLDVLPSYGVSFYPIGFLFASVVIFVFASVIVRYRIIDINITLRRFLFIMIGYFFVIGVPLLTVFFSKEYLVYLLQDKWWIAPILIGVLMAFIGLISHLYLKNLNENNILKMQKFYHNYLLETSRELIYIRDLRKLANLIVHILSYGLKTRNVKFFLYKPEKRMYEMISSRSYNEEAEVIHEEHPLVNILNKQKKIIVCEEILRMYNVDFKDLKKFEDVTGRLNSVLLMPCLIEKNMVGFVSLGLKRNKKSYTSYELALIDAISSHIALALENATYHIKMRDLETKRLASLGTMAGGFAKKISNPLLNLKLTALNTRMKINTQLSDLDKEYNFSEGNKIGVFLEDVKLSVNAMESKISHIEDIVRNMLSFTMMAGDTHRINIKTIIHRSLKMIPDELMRNKNVNILTTIEDNLPLIEAQQNELEQVFSEIFTNGIESFKRVKGKLSINVSNIGDDKKFVKIEITDSGQGIHANELNKIFDFFYTTKGLYRNGLGLAIAHRILTNHNGWIDVKSKVEEGTVFTVYLPTA